MARPKIELDYDVIEKLANIQCTQKEIATFLGCSVDTLQRDEKFCDLYNKGKENGKMSLRRMQFKLAEKSYAMAIWLGKQYLGQRDVPEQQEKSENGILQELVEAIRDDKNTKRDTES